MSEDLEALRVDAAATFVVDADGRIARENEPGISPGPRLFVGGCAEGQVVLARQDVDAGIVARARELAAEPWPDLDAPHPRLAELAALFPDAEVSRALIYRLPQRVSFDADATFVDSETAEGDALLVRLAQDGMPPHLVEAGFVGLEDFWKPWCAALVEGEIAAMAFAARLGEQGAEIGVYTFTAWRRRGLAAAVTARWASLPGLAGRLLFYSTLTGNLSSQKVAARLGLPRLGASFRIS